MSGFGNFMAGALVGAGNGVSSIASRYIDEEIQRNRAQAIADIQHANMVRGEEYIESAPVQERRLGNERNLLQMRNQQQLASREAEASSPTLRQARIDDRVSFLEGTTPAEIASQNAITEGTSGAKLDADRMRAKVMTPLEIERARGIADAQWGARSAYDERLEGKTGAGGKGGAKMSEAGKLQLQDINKQDEALQKAINDGVAGGTLKQDPNDPAWQHFTRQKQALQVQKLRIFAREGLISGEDEAKNLIDAGASPADLQVSVRQAQLIGGDYAKEFASTVNEHLSRVANKAQPSTPQASNTTSLVEQRRNASQASASGQGVATPSQPTEPVAPEGSPQAKWNARQRELRQQEAEREARRSADQKRMWDQFDIDAQTLTPIEMLRKYDGFSTRRGLDIERLARLKTIEKAVR